MSTHEPDDSDGDWVRRYRQASDTDAPMPSAATRESILAEGRRVAAARAADPTTHRFDQGQPAANQPRWKLAAASTVGAALFAAVLMYPHLGAPPSVPRAEMDSITASAPAPAPESKKQSGARESAADATVEEVVVSGGRRLRAPDRAEPRKAQSTSAPNADATSRMAAPAASPPLAQYSARTAQAMRSNLASDSLLSKVLSGDLAGVSASLNEGANPEQVDSMGRTPLLLAVIAHREDMVGLLLAHHADPNVADQSGQTPLQRAHLDAQLDIVRLLEGAGAR